MNFNPFKNDTQGSYNPSTATYTAPIAGYYHVSAKVHKMIPTGKFEWRKDWSRKWYQFWKPRLVYREIFETAESEEGSTIIYAQKGEVFGTKVTLDRVGN